MKSTEFFLCIKEVNISPVALLLLKKKNPKGCCWQGVILLSMCPYVPIFSFQPAYYRTYLHRWVMNTWNDWCCFGQKEKVLWLFSRCICGFFHWTFLRKKIRVSTSNSPILIRSWYFAEVKTRKYTVVLALRESQ